MGVGQVLGTSPARFPWRCGFGCRIGRLRHMNNTNDLRQLAAVDVRDSLQRWEPRAQATKVEVSKVEADSRSTIDLALSLRIGSGAAVTTKQRI